jgi:hypothetical protein
VPVQYSEAIRNARLQSDETVIGASAILRIRSGAPPANCAAARSGTVLATLTLPADWQAAPSAGSAAKSGTWQDLTADASGVAGHFEITDSSGATCHMQGTVTATGGGGDMTINNTNVAAGQPVEVTAFSRTAFGA